jgi:hypothetical protein
VRPSSEQPRFVMPVTCSIARMTFDLGETDPRLDARDGLTRARPSGPLGLART